MSPNYGITVLDGERKEPEGIPPLALQPVDVHRHGHGRIDVEGRKYLYVSPGDLREVANALEEQANE